MAWSTRELAKLAGTTVNTVRHYHRLGLLEEPARENNGYKQYEVRHLVRLLRIRRLSGLGVPLGQIGEVGAGGETTLLALRELDDELAANIDRLEKARADIAAIVRARAPADVPAGFESVAFRLSQADSSMIHLYTQPYDEAALADVRTMVEQSPKDIDDELNALAVDADEMMRQELAERLAPDLARSLHEFPWLRDPVGNLRKSMDVTAETFVEALVELYHHAQLDVLARASLIASEFLSTSSDTDDGPVPPSA
ncbi:MerR family transcriptional regulator [Microbacterium paludicola]|uniref:MerR family transcriptional regulator n=1 Tax=Microbacterium paludicola TaxID=300019 RepID=A0A4Y9FZW0_9MICO|nr:MerR family transcriptional regulator [Microbacterium paludicola]MBF0815555.1 MerR family transcriptional regulator [Microbacterium paludicola]TFU33817.1 MerR family transcriptional regulator [Microbacterium paludicola]